MRGDSWERGSGGRRRVDGGGGGIFSRAKIQMTGDSGRGRRRKRKRRVGMVVGSTGDD